MSRKELVEKYLGGQMSRRVFLRRLMGTGVSAAAASAYVALLAQSPANARVYDYYIFVQDNDYLAQSEPLKAALGSTVGFGFGSSGHSATDRTRWINSGFRQSGGLYERLLVSSGTYEVRCLEKDHPPMSISIRVPIGADPLSGPLGTSFDLNWGQTSPAPAGYVYDVQIRRPDANTFEWFRKGTTDRGAAFQPGKRGRFRFRARLRRLSSGNTTAWSPVRTLHVT